MKIRLGFVSNSSSSSFAIWGTAAEKPPRFDDSWDWEQAMEEEGLEHYNTGYDNLVGMSPDRQRDDETLGSFKLRIMAAINKTCLPDDQTVAFFSEEYEC